MTGRHPDPSDDGHRWRGMRAVNAAGTGLVAGVCGVVLIRAVFGPGVVLAGASVGLLAMIVAAAVSWRALPSGRRRRRRSALGSGRRLRRRVHPVGWIAPVIGSGVALVSFAAVAHSSGSGWVQAVGALLAGVLLTGLIAPVVPARRAHVVCTSCPSDAEAGRPIEITMTANGPLRLRPLDPSGPEARATGPIRGPRQVVVTFNPERRGVLTAVKVEVASSAPFGLMWWARQTMVVLPRPLHVAPRLGQARLLATAAQDPPGDAWRRRAADTGEPRGIRPYQAGDTRRSVHWPATSHVGRVMVRERERQTDDPLLVELVLPVDLRAAEAETEVTRASITDALVRGRAITLQTQETDGVVTRLVRDRIDLGRRLARAVPAPTEEGRRPEGDR